MGRLEFKITHEIRHGQDNYWYKAGWGGLTYSSGHMIGTEAEALAEAERRAMWIKDRGNETSAPVIVFGGERYYPGGGVSDLIGTFPSHGTAIDSLDARSLDWLQFCDPNTLTLIAEATSDSQDNYAWWCCTYLIPTENLTRPATM